MEGKGKTATENGREERGEEGEEKERVK